MKKVIHYIGLLGLLCYVLPFFAFSKNSFQIVPAAEHEAQADAASKALIDVGTGDFWSKYNQSAKTLDLGDCIRSGICGWDDVLNLGVYVLRFVMQLALVVGSGMLIWSGYTYALVAIGAKDKPEEASGAIKNALYGLFIISISYTLIKLLQMAFLS